eukprot:scaffold71943_cov64-Phaeocystis_antarctica.AAC.2
MTHEAHAGTLGARGSSRPAATPPRVRGSCLLLQQGCRVVDGCKGCKGLALAWCCTSLARCTSSLPVSLQPASRTMPDGEMKWLFVSMSAYADE